jgi:hypothetical protein
MRLQSSQKARWSVVFLVVAGLCGYWAATDWGAHDAPSNERTAANSADNRGGTSKLPSDERCRELVVGTWKDEYQGQRTMTVRPDGTATMIVELEGMSAKLYASRMTFEEKWSIDRGQLKLKAVGGEPEVRVNLILSMMGDTSDLKILDLTTDRMLLLDADGTTKYDWKRVRDE